jgi:[NiFe] hydrogenase large subunit
MSIYNPTTNRIVVDPVTRIEGHLRIEVQVAGGKVTNAWSTGTLFRGIELILKGRNPEDAWLFTQRLCGVCTYVHGVTSVRAVEDAINLAIPDNARILRNLLMGSQFLHDHIVHFYHLHALDWIDVLSALQADPNRAKALSAQYFPNAKAIDFKAVQDRVKAFAASGQLGPFAGAYWGHPEYQLDPEINLIFLAHYLEALHQQTRTARMHAIFGGKNPHPQSLMIGGVTSQYDLTSARIAEFRALLDETNNFIDTIYIPGVTLLAKEYGRSGWGAVGMSKNFLAFGEFPETAQEPQSLFFPQGAILQRGAVSAVDTAAIVEHVKRSWYSGTTPLHPSVGVTQPAYTTLSTTTSSHRYSWLKAPRYQDNPMEVGPLARVLVAYGLGQSETQRAVDSFLAATGLPKTALYSTLGRTAARALETQIIGDAMVQWLGQLHVGGQTFPGWRMPAMPASAKGVALNEAPRGAVGHWIDIQNQKIANYQMVVPSTWNFGPRCANGQLGPVEKALIGTPVADPERPVEILRTVHSFDPCIACAVHVMDTSNDRVYKVKAL